MPKPSKTINTTKRSNAYNKNRKAKQTTKDIKDKANDPSKDNNYHTNDYYKSPITQLSDDVTIVDRFWADNRQRYKTDTEMFYAILDYFEKNAQTRHKAVDKKGLTVEKKEPMTMLALGLHLGIVSSTMVQYQGGEYDTEDANFSSLLKWARDVIQNDWQTQSAMGAYNERIAMLTLQSQYGWTVETKLDLHQKVEMSTEQALSELSQLFKEVKGLLPISEDADY